MKEYAVNDLLRKDACLCSCLKIHRAHVKDVIVGEGAIAALPESVKKYASKNVFMLADENTYPAAGERVAALLSQSGIAYDICMYGSERQEPDEAFVGRAVLHFPAGCDMIVGVGSGVINDTAKILSSLTGKPYILVATAPSMDGFVSSTSSVVRNGLKVSLNSRCADIVIGDTDILANAPPQMLMAGLGDMLAKYISLVEWKIGSIVIGEYYCDEVAAMVKYALHRCVENAEGLRRRDKKAVEEMMEGLVLSGIAADYAGVSRPVSGVEHYISHIWDMRALAFGTPFSLHGIQCGIGPVYALKGYELLKNETPDVARSEAYFNAFDKNAWFSQLKDFLGKAAEPMIKAAETGNSYNREKHRQRVLSIGEHWDEILNTVETQLPSSGSMMQMLQKIGAPVVAEDIGLSSGEIPLIFRMTADIRDKYILSSLVRDMGIIEPFAEALV